MVGILRQLGDLAQFAAEMFQDLHEEVNATAARSRGLTDRVKHLDADVLCIESVLLSKTDNSEFYYNAGVDWHPQICMNENIMAKGGMPRFIRKAYQEECHAPPQLFLLDKFDVGGAGTCLKRFTDPSFFSAQHTTSKAGKLEAQRDWRTLKIKKKISRWGNGDTSEESTASHAKLHQLLLEDHCENERKVTARLLSLKRRNFDSSTSSKNYMQKILHNILPEHSEALETGVEHGLENVAKESNSSSSFMDLETKSKYSHDFNIRKRNFSSDDIASATDTDAFADVESEVEAGNGYRHMKGHEYRSKKELRFFRNRSLNFPSVDMSNASDDGSASYMEETSFSSLHGVSPYDRHWTAKHGVSPYNKRWTGMEHGHREAEPFSSTETFEQILPSVDHTSDVGIYATASSDTNSRSRLREISDGFNFVTGNAQSYWADAAASALLGLNVNYGGQLSTENQDDAAGDSLSGHQDNEGHPGSNSFRDGDSGRVSISLSDLQEVGSQCSSSISSRWHGDPYSNCEMNRMEEPRRSQEGSFKQYDPDSSQIIRDWNSKLANHTSLDASSHTHSGKEWPLHSEEAVHRAPDFHHGNIPFPEEASAANFPSLDKKDLKQVRRKMMFQSDSSTNTFVDPTKESEANLETAPSLPPSAPAQWNVGKPHDSFDDSVRKSGDFSMESEMSSTEVTSSLKDNSYITTHGGEVKMPHEAHTRESSTHNSCKSSFDADSISLGGDKSGMLGHHSHFTSEEVITDSSIIHPRTHMEVPQSDKLAFARESQQSFSELPISVTNTDGALMDSCYHTTQITTAYTNETIQPKSMKGPGFPMKETTQPSIASQSIKPLLEDSVSEYNSPEVLLHTIDQLPDETKSGSKTEHAAQNPEEKIIECIEMPCPQIMNKRHFEKQLLKSTVREESWSRNHEDDNLVEKPAAKLARPRSTLIKSVDALDRSKWKKVTPRILLETPNAESVDKSKFNKVSYRSRPETPNVDGRDSILEVIRAKSFNLKPTPAPAPKPIIRAPTMNLKVSAILDKANRIRQATVGSDEEDDWSDE